jgi:hypothetical protein
MAAKTTAKATDKPAKPARRTIQVTKDYDLFERSEDNRDTTMAGRKKLIASMEKYGFIPSFPVVVRRDDAGKLVVVDGQHRLLIARHLGLPVYFVEESAEFVTAEVNETMRTWTVSDYVQTWARNGHKDYVEAQEFARRHGVTVGKACSILGGTVSQGNIDHQIRNGTFKIKDREWAEAVAGLYTTVCKLSKDISKTRFLEACMAVTRVKGFDLERMTTQAKKCREKLTGYSTRDGNLEMLEEVYNYGRKQMFGLKVAALMALRERSAAVLGHGPKKKACPS